jgi:hypothetical protein
MPSDILTTLLAQGVPSDALMGLGEALEAPLERVLGNEG